MSIQQMIEFTGILRFICLLSMAYLIYSVFLHQQYALVTEEFADWDSETDLVIVTAHFKENLDWLTHSPYPVVVCSKHSAESQSPSLTPELKCMVQNKGRETSSLLKFIIEFYEDLPKRIAFIHGHQYAWHQRFDILSAIGCAKKDKPYVSLNTIFMNDRNMQNQVYNEIGDMWETHFEPYLKIKFPERVFHDCCAQFIVSRAAIRRIPKAGYEHWLELVMNSPYDVVISVQFEYLWHVIFGEDPVLDLNAEAYVAEMFDCMPKFIPREIAEGSSGPTKFVRD